MFKRLLLLFSLVLIFSTESFAQYTTLSCGSPQYGWNAASPSNGTSSTGYALSPNLLFVTWQLGYASAPSSVTMTLEGSNDNSLWSTLGTSTSTTGQIQNVATAVKFIRVTQTARSGGSGVTLIFNCVKATSGGGGSGGTDYSVIEDDGSVLPSRATVNFIGAGVSCVDNVTKTDCTISAGGVSFPLAASTGCTAPDYSFTDDTGAGVCLVGANDIRLQVAGSGNNRGWVEATNLGASLNFINNTGQLSALNLTETGLTHVIQDGAARNIAHEPASTGIFVLTSAGNTINRSITSAAGTLIVTNADGVAGNINLDVDTSIFTQKGSGTADHPASCGEVGVDVFQVGDVYSETDEGRADFCVNLDTWASVFTAALPVSLGGTGLTAGTSGGILGFTGTTTLASSIALTANAPVIGGGAGATPTVGTRTGNTTLFVTSTGTQTSGRCVEIDANGNHIAAATACGTGSGTDSYQYLDSNLTTVGNVGTGDDTLHTTTISAGKLAANGDYAIMKTTGQFAASANNKRIRAKFGATTIFDTGALVITAATDWTLTCTVTRTGAATQRTGCYLNTSSATLGSYAGYATPAETLSGTVAFLVTGEATANDDVTARVTNWDFVSSVGTAPSPINLATSVTGTLPVANGGTGTTTLTGLLQGNGTSAITTITNSTTVGQVLRVSGSNTYTWGALDLADTDAITGTLPPSNTFDPGTMFRIYEEFCSGTTTTGQIGTNGLSVTLLATGTITYDDLTDAAGHPCYLAFNDSASDNSGGTIKIPTGVDDHDDLWDSTEWSWDVVIRTSAVTASAIYVGATQTSNPDTSTGAIWARIDSDKSDTNFTFQVCNAASAAGCQAAGDDTNSKVVAGTIAGTGATYFRLRARRVTSGVGGNPTIYFRANNETEKTFCSSGCDDTLGTIPSGNMLFGVTWMTRDTNGARTGQLDYIELVRTGMTRY